MHSIVVLISCESLSALFTISSDSGSGIGKIVTLVNFANSAVLSLLLFFWYFCKNPSCER